MRYALVFLALLLGCGDDDSAVTPDAGPLPEEDAGTTEDAGPPEEDAGDPCPWEGEAEDPIEDTPPFTPRWAFEPWISKDISDREDTDTFIAGFLERDIPVGALVLDSPWETNYNTFVPNPDRYGDFEELVDELHDQDIKIVLWVTQMVNVSSYDLEEGGDTYSGPSPNFIEGRACGFLVDEGLTYSWWKGRGAGVDFFHPEARAWWHEQQQPLLDMGLDGWKLDFGESYIRSSPNSYKDVETFEGTVEHQRYSEEYYADFLRFGRQERGREFVTMVRGFDVSYDHPPRFYARPEHAPVAWMGDNHRDWTGLVDALDHTFRSALEGYVAVGSDIGGYLDRDELMLTRVIPFSQEVFARWIAMEAMTPFFQLHGRANLEPWNVEVRPDETVEIYRYWAKLHSELVPFWFSAAQEAYAGGPNIVRPIGDEPEDWAGDWRFEVGDAFLVAPIIDEVTERDVELPEGTWYDWFDLGGDAIDGDATVTYDVTDRRVIPVFVRAGAIVPMSVSSDTTGFGTEASADAHTILVFPSDERTTFDWWITDDESSELAVERDGGQVDVEVPATEAEVYLRVQSELEPDLVRIVETNLDVVADRAALDDATEGSWYYDDASNAVWIKLPAGDARTVVLEYLAG